MLSFSPLLLPHWLWAWVALGRISFAALSFRHLEEKKHQEYIKQVLHKWWFFTSLWMWNILTKILWVEPELLFNFCYTWVKRAERLIDLLRVIKKQPWTLVFRPHETKPLNCWPVSWVSLKWKIMYWLLVLGQKVSTTWLFRHPCFYLHLRSLYEDHWRGPVLLRICITKHTLFSEKKMPDLNYHKSIPQVPWWIKF